MKNSKILACGLAAVFLGSGLAGCEKKEAVATTDTTTTVTTGSATGLTSEGIVNEERGMYVHPRNDTGNYTYKIRNRSNSESIGADSTCEITNTTSVKDIVCVLEAPELDLYFFGAKINVNIPVNMGCTYYSEKIYWHYTHSAGVGSPMVAYRIRRSADGGGTVPIAPQVGHGTTWTVPGDEPVCTYDHSASDGPNCCVGPYQKFVETWSEELGAYVGESSDGDWGGDYAACVGGAAKDLSELTETGYPKTKIGYVEGTGYTTDLEIPSPLEKEKGSNVYLANYYLANYTLLENAAANYNSTTRVVGAPNHAALLAPAGGVSPNLFYEWHCLDRAHEVKARIRLQIQEWDEFAIWESGTDPDTGYAPTAEGPTPPGSNFFLNDFFDWRDFANAFPGS